MLSPAEPLAVRHWFVLRVFQRALAPPDVHHERLLLVSVLGFVVNLVGIFVFKHGGHGHSHGSGMAARALCCFLFGCLL